MPEPAETPNNNPDLVLDPPTREISQTDQINKKLLASLFKRMDEVDTPQPDNDAADEDEWKD